MNDPEREYWLELTSTQVLLAQHANRLAAGAFLPGSVKHMADIVRIRLDRLEALAKEVEA